MVVFVDVLEAINEVLSALVVLTHHGDEACLGKTGAPGAKAVTLPG